VLGSVSRALAASAPLPVVVVPPTARLTHSARAVAEPSLAEVPDTAPDCAARRGEEDLVDEPTSAVHGTTMGARAAEHHFTGAASQFA
jgi:hypothetical protein